MNISRIPGAQIVIIICSALLAGCASVSGAKVSAPLELKSGYANLYIIRPGNVVGMLMNAPIFVDDREVGLLTNNSYLAIHIPPGKHTVRTKWRGLNAMFRDTTNGIELPADSTTTVVFDMSMDGTPGVGMTSYYVGLNPVAEVDVVSVCAKLPRNNSDTEIFAR